MRSRPSGRRLDRRAKRGLPGSVRGLVPVTPGQRVAGLDPDDERDHGRRSDSQRRQRRTSETHQPDASEPADRGRQDRPGGQPDPERDHEHQHEQGQREQLERAELAPEPIRASRRIGLPADLDLERSRIELLPKLCDGALCAASSSAK